jgi:hypothetical protein
MCETIDRFRQIIDVIGIVDREDSASISIENRYLIAFANFSAYGFLKLVRSAIADLNGISIEATHELKSLHDVPRLSRSLGFESVYQSVGLVSLVGLPVWC